MTADGTATSVTVLPGAAWINGYNYRLTAPLELPVQGASAANPRCDRVVLRWSLANRAINLAIAQGVPAANPAPPPLTRNDNVYELGLAEIIVQKNAAVIQQSDVTDTRLIQTVCGLVNSLVLAVYE